MGIFFSDKKIYKEKFKKILRQIPQLSPQERQYVLGVFQDALNNGLSKEEIRREINQLKRDYNDILDSNEVDKLKNKLLEYF